MSAYGKLQEWLVAFIAFSCTGSCEVMLLSCSSCAFNTPRAYPVRGALFASSFELIVGPLQLR